MDAITRADAENRLNNLLAVAILAVSGIAFAATVVLEDGWVDRADDIFMLVLAAAAVAWYLAGTNRYRRSLVPLALVGLALLAKASTIPQEMADKAALADDVGPTVLYAATLGLVVWRHVRAKGG